MKRLVKSIALIIAIIAPSAAGAQEASIGADLVSSYVWRGQKLGDAAIQPYASLEYNGFGLEAWGSYGLVNSDDAKEIDFTLSYNLGGLTVAVTDYWVSGIDPKDRYFLYGANKGGHTFEANIGYDFDFVSVNWYTNFAGIDGVNKDGDRAYSSYFEVAAPFSLGGLEWNAAVGGVPFATDYYEEMNSEGFAITNVTLSATKEIKVTNTFTLPVNAAISANPSAQSMYFVVGVSF